MNRQLLYSREQLRRHRETQQQKRRRTTHQRSQKHHRWKANKNSNSKNNNTNINKHNKDNNELTELEQAADHWRSTQPILSPPLSCASLQGWRSFPTTLQLQLQKTQEPPQELQHHT